ncbi:hypothetical protein AB205_0025490 [Aquarana catesbeiana]|uniref:Uncharacterized protein n=1 Tax=Aquarana catesbeiana TaxID=8400 RepID=A0A2G9RX91_AQUCT|nr:hypothetical protein AB205_0025490 [Aquarana catesbeiana]
MMEVGKGSAHLLSSEAIALAVCNYTLQSAFIKSTPIILLYYFFQVSLPTV